MYEGRMRKQNEKIKIAIPSEADLMQTLVFQEKSNYLARDMEGRAESSRNRTTLSRFLSKVDPMQNGIL